MALTTRSVRAVATLVVAAAAAACTSAPPAATTDRILTVYLSEDWVDAGPVVEAVRTFERDHPGVDVQLEAPEFSDIPTAVRTATGAGRSVDLAQWHAFAAGARGWAEPLDDLWESFEPDRYLEGAVDDVTWEDTVYGIPLDTNAMVMVTNDDLLRGAGVDPGGIDTFDDLAAAARAVSRPNGFGFLASASSWVTYGLVRANGGEVVETEGGQARFTLDAPEVVETFTLLHELVRDGHVLAPDLPNYSGDAYSLFVTGTTAILFTGSWDIASLQSDEGLEFSWSVHPVPRGADDGGTVLGGSSLYVPTGATDRELAVAFARHLTADEVALELWRQEGRLPARADLLDADVGAAEPYATVVGQLPAASPMRLIAFPVADRVLEDLLPTLLSGGEDDPADLLAGAQRRAAGEAP